MWLVCVYRVCGLCQMLEAVPGKVLRINRGTRIGWQEALFEKKIGDENNTMETVNI